MRNFVLALLVLSVASAQTAPPPVTQKVNISAGAPLTNVDGSYIGPQGFLFYDLYQAVYLPPVAATGTSPAIPAGVGPYTKVAADLLPGATYTVGAKLGACFTISAHEYVDPSIASGGGFAPVWTPMESDVVEPAGLGCVTPIAGVTSYAVTLNVVPW